MLWMTYAWTQQGIAETPGAEANPQVLGYFRAVGQAGVTSDEVPWCAAFVGACLEQAGIASTKQLNARSYLEHGAAVPLASPRVGCVAVFRRDAAGPEAGHCGFVTGWTDTTIALLGGNQGDRVSVAHFSRSELIGLRWPGVPVTAAELAADGSRIVGGALAQVRDTAKAGLALVGAGGLSVTAPKTPLQTPKVIGHVTQMMYDAGVIERFAIFAWQKGPWLLGALAVWWLGSIAVKAGWIAEARVEDRNTGKTA